MMQRSLFRPTITERFEKYHAANPEVYAELVRLARQQKAKGHNRGSIDLLCHVVRWKKSLRVDRDETWKLDNCFTALYARLIMQQEGDLANFFETRVRKAA